MNKKIHEIIHPFLLKMMSLKRKETLKIDGEFDKSKNFLIVANHLCINDIPALAEAVKEHFYVLVSDEDKNTFNGKCLDLNGVKWVTRTNKESRSDSKKHLINELKGGKSYAMYPEATWNLSPNLLMLPMNYGCIDIALKSNVDILPVVTFFDRKTRYSTIGKPYTPKNDLVESITDLRNIMATMVFEQMKKSFEERYKSGDDSVYKQIIDGREYYYEKRENISGNYWKNYIMIKYGEYSRAKKDPEGVKQFESQFIYEPKTDDYAFFQIFNSIIKITDDKKIQIKRISSEKDGYNDGEFGTFFGDSYNEENYKKFLIKK